MNSLEHYHADKEKRREYLDKPEVKERINKYYREYRKEHLEDMRQYHRDYYKKYRSKKARMKNTKK